MNTKTGYQILEPTSLELLYDKHFSFDFTISILTWLADIINQELSSKNIKAKVKVITVEYNSKYPALGAYYFDQETRSIEDSEDIEDFVDMICKNHLESASLSTFLTFTTKNIEQLKLTINDFGSDTE